jgi:Mg2+-importing ATPase
MARSMTDFWGLPICDVIERLGSGLEGLSGEEASRRHKLYGSNLLRPRKKTGPFTLLLAQFKSPLIIILLFAAGLSFFLHEPVDALIIGAIVLLSGFLGFLQEKRAADAVDELLAIVHIRAQVVRDRVAVEVPVEEVVPGDICIFDAGDLIPADCLILESKDLFVDEAALTGEGFPRTKGPACSNLKRPSAKGRTACLWARTLRAAAREPLQ